MRLPSTPKTPRHLVYFHFSQTSSKTKVYEKHENLLNVGFDAQTNFQFDNVTQRNV